MRAKRWMGFLAGLPMVAALLAACGAAAPTVTPVLPPFQSGGIGLTRAAWEQQHPPLATPTVLPMLVWYPESRYQIFFWQDSPLYAPTADSVIAAMNFDTQADTPAARSAVVHSFLPADAQRDPKEGYDPFPKQEIWYSQSLVSRYPSLLGVPQPWGELPPGRIMVHYSQALNGGQSFANVSASLNYPLAPTQVIPTLTPCGDHPCPTPTLPSAARTAVGSPLPTPVLTRLPVPLHPTVPLVPIPTITLPRTP